MKESLPLVLEELSITIKTLIVLEKSDQETIISIEKFNCKILFQRNKGYGDALIQGIKSVERIFLHI